MELENTGVAMTDELEKLIREDAERNGLQGKVTVNLKAPGYKKAKIGLKSEEELPVSSITAKGSPEQRDADAATLQAYLDKQQELTGQLAKAMFRTADSRNQQATAYTRYGEAAATAGEAKGAIEVASLLHKANIANIVNADVQNPNNAIVAAQKVRSEAQYKMDTLRPIIETEDAVQIWDDPLRWVANQFTLPKLKQEYNAAFRADSAMVKRIAETTQLADSINKISPAMVAADIQKHAAASAEAARFEALAKAADSHAAASSVLAQSLLQESVANEHSIEKRFQWARLYQDQLNFKRTQDADRRGKAEDARLQDGLDAINTKLAAWKMPALDVAQLKLQGPEFVRDVMNWAQYGEYGKGPGDTLLNISKFATPAKVAESDGVLTEFLTKLSTNKEFQQLAASKQMDQKFQSLPADVKHATLLQELFQKQQAELVTTNGDNSRLVDSNPYKLRHLQTAYMDELKGNQFVKVMGETAALSSDKKTVDDKQILLAALGKVEAEPASRPIVAKELAEYYTKAADLQWRKGGAMMTGYPRPVKYGVTDPFGDGKTPLNMYSALEIEAWMSRQMAKKLSNTRVPGEGNMWDFFGQSMSDNALPFGDPLGINK